MVCDIVNFEILCLYIKNMNFGFVYGMGELKFVW